MLTKKLLSAVILLLLFAACTRTANISDMPPAAPTALPATIAPATVAPSATPMPPPAPPEPAATPSSFEFFNPETGERVVNAAVTDAEFAVLDARDLVNYNPLNFGRYAAYAAQNPGIAIDKIILYVNCNADLPPYTNISVIADVNSVFAPADKFHRFPDGFAPKTEVIGGAYWVREAGEAWGRMRAAALKDGVLLNIDNTYRGIAAQKITYGAYVARDGAAKADTYSARPGHSEHHTGYCVDIAGMKRIRGTAVDLWIRENAYKYGFIVSYQEHKAFITRYSSEPWHLRWYPQEAADIMFGEDLTVAEYDNLYLNPRAHGFVPVVNYSN